MKLDNLEWTIQHILNDIKYAKEEESENGVWIGKCFITKTLLESIDEVIKDFHLQIDR